MYMYPHFKNNTDYDSGGKGLDFVTEMMLHS